MDNKFTLLVQDKSILCRTFTLDEYEELVMAKLNGSIIQTTKALVQSCAPSATDLPKHWAEYVLVQIWMRSLDELVHHHDWVCSCGKEIPLVLDFNQIQVSDETELVYKLKHLNIKLRYPKLFEDSNTADMIMGCIESIITPKEEIPISELDDQELGDLVGLIEYEDVDAIQKLLLEPQIQMGVPVKCECGNQGVHIIKGFAQFMKLIEVL
ncbi:hypothetical protein [Cronobacter phage vB_Cdu_VP8]|nr:hypothetical protein [Cronobacter phage vB_Cdu_VP8]